MGSIYEQAITIVAPIVKDFEGLSLKPYICPAGYPTIGYGCTFYKNGKTVSMSDPPITIEEANELLYHNLSRFIIQTVALCPTLAVSSPERLAAIVDFVYNLGSGRLKISTLRKRINENRWDDVPAELSKWVYGGGQRLPGLIRRRQAEINLLKRN